MIFFIAIMASIALELSFRIVDEWRRFGWFAQFTDWVCHRLDSISFSNGPLMVIAIIAPLLIAVGLVSSILGAVWGGLDFIFSVLVLTLSLGPVDPIRQARDYVKALQSNDADEASLQASKILGCEVDEEPVLVAEKVKQVLLIKSCSGIIGVFVLFIILGPIGAAMFRLSCLLKDRYADVQTDFAKSVNDLYAILMWLPARVTVLCFALVGNFVDVVHSLKGISDLWQTDSDELLIETGIGALHECDLSDTEKVNDEHVYDCLSLVKRAVVAFLTLLGVVVIVSWIV